MEHLKVNKNPGLFTRIEATLPKLRGAEKKVVRFIEKNVGEIIHLSITEVAERSQTSESSVVRLCKRLGYKGFQDMKIHFAKEVISPEQQIHEVIEKDDDVLRSEERRVGKECRCWVRREK